VRRWESELLRSEKLIGLGRLAATIAHEIRNPLGIIKATAQRLDKLGSSDQPDRAKQRELLRYIPEEADRLDRILTGYLRIDSQPGTTPEPVDIAQQLPEWLAAIASEGSDGRGRPELHIEQTPPILVDPDTPRQVLLNLMRNAFDAASSPSAVHVRWEQIDSKTGQLTVADDGPGVARARRDKIFEPFYTTKTKGSGLGLYAVKMMVERDGGAITVTDNPGGGARFIVRWPFTQRGNESQD
jgi:two-component system sensor histidine kinase PilS (NtrC family)